MKAEIEKLTINIGTRTLELTREEYDALRAHFEAQQVSPQKEYIPYPVYPQPYYPVPLPWWDTTTRPHRFEITCGNDITLT